MPVARENGDTNARADLDVMTIEIGAGAPDQFDDLAGYHGHVVHTVESGQEYDELVATETGDDEPAFWVTEAYIWTLTVEEEALCARAGLVP